MTRGQIEFYFVVPGATEQEPDARIYQHADGFPSYILPALRYLEALLKVRQGIHGSRNDDAEFAGAEYIRQFSLPFDAVVKSKSGCVYFGPDKRFYRSKGNVYTTQTLHGDTDYLYRVICDANSWDIKIYEPEQVNGVDTFRDITDQFDSEGKRKETK